MKCCTLLLLCLAVCGGISRTGTAFVLERSSHAHSSLGVSFSERVSFGGSSRVSSGVSSSRLFAADPVEQASPSSTTVTPTSVQDGGCDVVQVDQGGGGSAVAAQSESAYTRGFLTIGFICLLNASTNPLWHAAFAGSNTPPPLFMNAAIAITALCGLLAGAPLMQQQASGDLSTSTKSTTTTTEDSQQQPFADFLPTNTYAGMELGFWKCLGTTAHVLGLSMTTANHGAFLIQLTTLMVPVLQGLQGERIPRQIQLAVVTAMTGVFLFTQDPSGSIAASSTAAATQQLTGDALCVAAALFYSLYDIQTFKWGKTVPRAELVTTKVATQAAMSVGLCAAAAGPATMDYLTHGPPATSLIPVVLWSGLIVNALATFLQVAGMQSVGPVRAQLIFASQPLWSAGLSYVFLAETVGPQGAAGGTAFLAALYMAATAPKPGDDNNDALEKQNV